MPAPTPSTITPPEFHRILTRYPSLLPHLTTPRTTPPLPDLDSLRRHTLPALIRTRTPPHLTAAELLSILHCKLKRGTFRPSLPRLVASNPEPDVVAATAAAFACLAEGEEVEVLMRALRELCKLRGVGVATASYVLALVRDVPVFSDEGYAWVMGAGGRLRYDEREYRGYVEACGVLAGRLGVGKGEVEMVGWVLGKEAQGVGKGEGAEGGDVGRKGGKRKAGGGGRAAKKGRAAKVEVGSGSGEDRPLKKGRTAVNPASEEASAGRVLRPRKPKAS